MIFSLASLLLLHLYPLYATYKALSSHTSRAVPYTAGQQQAELETWLMFWSTNAILYIVSSFFEWSWSWIPFYSEFKFLFVLWLILPQTRGSTYLYLAYVSPFLTSHEGDIDRALSSASASLKRAGLSYIEAAWEKVKEMIWQMNVAEASNPGASSQAPPTQHNPAQGAVGQLFGLVKSYAPKAVAGAGAMLSAGAAASQTQNAFALSGAGAARMAREPEARGVKKQSSSASLQQRMSREEKRRELKRQLEELELQQDSGSSSASSTGDGVHLYQNPPSQRATSGGGWLNAFRSPSNTQGNANMRSGSSSGGGSSGRPSPDMPNVALGTATGAARGPAGAQGNRLGRRAVSSSAANASAAAAAAAGAAASSSGLLGGGYELLDRFSVDVGGGSNKQGAKAR